jgi:hypothetical protein
MTDIGPLFTQPLPHFPRAAFIGGIHQNPLHGAASGRDALSEWRVIRPELVNARRAGNHQSGEVLSAIVKRN